MTETKTCNTCCIPKPLEAFGVSGLYTRNCCKECTATPRKKRNATPRFDRYQMTANPWESLYYPVQAQQHRGIS